jgi:hypothetical protein
MKGVSSSPQSLVEEPSAITAEETRSYSKAHSSVCDRRLSRAAREILKRKLQQTKTWADSDSTAGTVENDDTKGTDTTVWELLDRFLVSNTDALKSSSSTCPFDPTRDLLRHHEEHARTVPSQSARYSATHSPLVGRRRTGGKPVWHQCGLCHKTFSSRYYLDQHFDSNHAQELSSETSTSTSKSSSIGDSDADPSLDADTMDINYYCPAVEWCRAFSDQACQDMAQELEPYYDRGSDGYGNDRWTVARKLAQAAHAVPCTTAAMHQATLQCRRSVGACFGSEQGDNATGFSNKAVPGSRRLMYLEESLCPTMSCHGRLHSLFAGASTKVRAASTSSTRPPAVATVTSYQDQIQEWQDEWNYYNQEHGRIGWMGLSVIAALVLWYAVQVIQQQQHRAAQPRRTTAGTRLLRKQSSSSTGGSRSWSAPSSWWGSSTTSAFAGRKPKTH